MTTSTGSRQSAGAAVRIVTLLVWVCATLVSPRSHAESEPKKKPTAAAPAAKTPTSAATNPATASDADKTKAEGMARLAKDTAKAGNYALAAGMFLQAYSLAPDHLAYVFSAARAEHLAWKLKDAQRHYEEFLSKAGPDHKLAPRTRAFLTQVKAGRVADDAVKDRIAKSGAAARAQSGQQMQGGVRGPSMGGMLGLVATGTGAITVVAGGVLLALTQSDRTALESSLATKDDKGFISGASYAAAKAKSDEVVSTEKLSFGIMATGAVIAGAGVALWMLADGPTPQNDGGRDPMDAAGVTSVRIVPLLATRGLGLFARF